jgi:L-lactate dehydrogenase complex protein LldE
MSTVFNLEPETFTWNPYTMPEKKPKVALFVTCLVDLFRPSVGFAAVKLLEAAGCDVHIPENQTCCGQPAYNTGHSDEAREMALGVMDTFEAYDYTVIPSGSCAAMMKHHYPELFRADPRLADRAREFSEKVFELVSFLSDIRSIDTVPGSFNGSVTYHDSCSGLRKLGVKDQPRRLLRSIPGLNLIEMKQPEVCCGFGGSFSVKFPEISIRMAGDKARDIQDTGASLVLAGDMGCLLNISEALKKAGQNVQARHVAEILAGMDAPGEDG